MTSGSDRHILSEDQCPTVVPEGFSQAMLATNLREISQGGQGEPRVVQAEANPEEQAEFERRFGAVIRQLMTNFLKY